MPNTYDDSGNMDLPVPEDTTTTEMQEFNALRDGGFSFEQAMHLCLYRHNLAHYRPGILLRVHADKLRFTQWLYEHGILES